MIGITLSSFNSATREATLQRLLAAEGLGDAKPHRSPTGKPYLEAASGAASGLAITHVRKGPTPISIMAISREALLGLDAEFWPEANADMAFLHSIAAPEDAPLIKQLASTGRDAATFLWVIKEAALKASGEVMTDPRCISVELSPNGHFWAATSRSSAKPVAEACVHIWRFSARDWEGPGLVAIGFSGAAAKPARLEAWEIKARGLSLLEF